MNILLIGRHYGHEFDLLREEVERRGGTATIVDTRDWPSTKPLTLEPRAEKLQIGENSWDINAIDGVYFRQNSLFVPAIEDYLTGCVSEDENPYSVITQLREYRGLLRSILKSLDNRDTSVAPGVGALEWQERSVHATDMFDSLGISSPATIATLDSAEAKRFLKQHGRIVYKPVAELGEASVMTEDEAEQLDGLATPVVLQELITGEDVRVYVVNGELVGAFKYVTGGDHFSFKQSADEPKAESVELPNQAKEDALKAVEASPMSYSAVDLRLSEDGTHTLLEVNAGGRFMLADSSGVTNVTEALAEYLLN